MDRLAEAYDNPEKVNYFFLAQSKFILYLQRRNSFLFYFLFSFFVFIIFSPYSLSWHYNCVGPSESMVGVAHLIKTQLVSFSRV